MEMPTPQPQHLWLQQLVGEWDFAHECSMGPDQAPSTWAGQQSTRAIGELWILGEMSGALPGGGESRNIITLGFDPVRAKFVGTFVSSCMTHLWPYEGSLDAAGKVLTLDSEGPSFAGDGTMAHYQDIIEVIDHDQYTMGSRVQGADGTWTHFMQGTYRRKTVG